MKKPGKKAVLFVFLLAGLAAASVLFLLSGRDAGTDFFKSSLDEAVQVFPGWSLRADRFSGNPVTGFTAWNVRVSFGDEEIARAENLTVSLSLLSLLKGSAGINSITVKNAFLASEPLLAAVKKTDLPQGSGESSLALPVIILTPSEVSTPLGSVTLDLLRLTPGQGTVTLEGKGNFLGMPVEMGGSLAEDAVISLTNGFLRAGEMTAALSGEVFPEFFLEGNVHNLNLEKAGSLFSLPFSMKGTVDSTLTVSRPGGKLLLSGEGEILGGDIWDLLTEGRFLWSADGEKATLSPAGGKVFSSPVEGSLSVFFAPVPLAEINLGLKNVDFLEWTRFFSWLSFGRGTLSSLRVDLDGPFDRLGGPVSFASPGVDLEGFPVGDLKGSLELTDGNLIDLRASGKWHASTFDASGKVAFDENDRTETTLEIRSDRFDLKSSGAVFAPGLGLAGTGTGKLSLKYPFEGKMSLSGALAAPKISVLGTPASNLSASFTGTADALNVSSLSLSIPGGGTVSGKGTLSGLSGDTPAMAFEGEGKNIRWAFIESLASSSKPLNASGTADLRWSARSPLSAPSVEFEVRGKDTPLSKTLPLRGTVLKGRFSGGELSLSEAAASLWGGRVKLSGKASSLTHSPALNFRGTFSGISLREAAEDMGTPLPSSSGALAGEFSLSGKAASPVLSLSANGPEFSAGGLSIRSLSARAEGTLPTMKLTSFSARILDSPVTAGGTLELKEKGKINLSASSGELDLRKISAAFFPDVSLGGTASGKVTLSGTMGGAPAAVFSGTSPLVTFHGLLLEKAVFSLKPDGKGAYALSAEGVLGKSILAVEGKMALTKKGTEITLKNSKKIDLGATAAGLSAQASGMVSGEADFTARGILNEKGNTWEGRIRSSSLGFYRTEVTAVDIPFTWKDSRINVRDGKAEYHGGPAAISGMVDPATMRWEGNLTVKGMDLGGATAKLLGGKGSVTGKADLTARGSGTGGMVGMVFGSGQLSAKDGTVSGFDALKSVSDTGVVKFSSVLASFNLDGRNIFILPGSRVSAPVGDNVYRYFSASGSLGWNDSPLDLKCVGDINVKALNAFLGALQGIISVDGNPLTDPAFLQKFLSGLLGGMSVRDFRETSFNLKGTWDSPVLTDLKVTSAASPASIPRPGSSGRNETQIKITVEIPTGEGKDTSPSTEDQVKKQLLENIMKQIIRPGTDDGAHQE